MCTFLYISILRYFFNKEIAYIKREAITFPVRKVWSLIQVGVLVLLYVSILGDLDGSHETNPQLPLFPIPIQ